MLDGDFVAVLNGELMVGEKTFAQHGFYFAHGDEEGVVGADWLETVGCRIGQEGIGWQCVYLRHGLSNNYHFLYMYARTAVQYESIGTKT